MKTQEQLDGALKALEVTDQTVLFVDIDQIPLKNLERWEALPKNLLIVGVRGVPNVESMTRSELAEILKRKK